MDRAEEANANLDAARNYFPSPNSSETFLNFVLFGWFGWLVFLFYVEGFHSSAKSKMR
jgi:hypothetical protein